MVVESFSFFDVSASILGPLHPTAPIRFRVTSRPDPRPEAFFQYLNHIYVVGHFSETQLDILRRDVGESLAYLRAILGLERCPCRLLGTGPAVSVEGVTGRSEALAYLCSQVVRGEG